jgi:hypothetical protein
MDGDNDNASLDLNVVVILVHNTSTMYRMTFEAPFVDEAERSWNVVLSYDECRKLKQDLKRMGVRMKAPFPNASILKTITEEDLGPLTMVRKVKLVNWCTSVFVC